MYEYTAIEKSGACRPANANKRPQNKGRHVGPLFQLIQVDIGDNASVQSRAYGFYCRALIASPIYKESGLILRSNSQASGAVIKAHTFYCSHEEELPERSDH